MSRESKGVEAAAAEHAALDAEAVADELDAAAETREYPACAGCTYWVGLNTPGFAEQVHGNCHRYPATLRKGRESWCGEWRMFG